MMRGQWMPVERAFRYMSRNLWRLVLKFLLFLFALLLSVTMGVARRARARVVSYRMQLRELRQRQTMEANDRDQAQRERVELTRRRKDCAVCLKPAKYRCARCDAPRFCSKSCRFQHWRQSHKRGGRAGASSSSARGDTD